MTLNMIYLVLAVLILPSLILADTQCPGGDISCPEGKTCCTVEGRPSCCDEDSEAKLPHAAAFFNVNSSIVLQNSSWDQWNTGCTFLNCQGTCCGTGSMDCCPIKMATCCPNKRCCEFGSSCCNGNCCPFMAKCCGSWCCKSNQRCGAWETCINAAVTLAPTAAMVSMVFLWLAVKMVSLV